MAINQLKMQGKLPVITLVILVLVIVGGVYAYIDHKADARAEQFMQSMTEGAEKQGITLSYDQIDTSPIAGSVTLQNFKVDNIEQEPDIIIGKLIISDLNWQQLNENNDRIPLAMNIAVTDGKIILDEGVVGNDSDLQAFVAVMGHEVPFSTYINYKLDEDSGILTASFIQSVHNNFSIKTNLTFGNTGWLPYVQTNQSPTADDNLTLDLLATTLNGFAVTFRNEGIIEKLRALVAQRSGQTYQQSIQQAVQQLRHIQASLNDYSPVYSLMIEELIKFVQQPQQLLISIDPEQPLTSDDFLKVFMGGQAAPFDLLQKARLFIKAN